jgi:hypothetical protein
MYHMSVVLSPTDLDLEYPLEPCFLRASFAFLVCRVLGAGAAVGEHPEEQGQRRSDGDTDRQSCGAPDQQTGRQADTDGQTDSTCDAAAVAAEGGLLLQTAADGASQAADGDDAPSRAEGGAQTAAESRTAAPEESGLTAEQVACTATLEHLMRLPSRGCRQSSPQEPVSVPCFISSWSSPTSAHACSRLLMMQPAREAPPWDLQHDGRGSSEPLRTTLLDHCKT